ncbi:uncharacterized protein LOC111699967 [Eurytemora carolleeae]|uniref:uncharacterized protein LOC111699967 n=1 Tax=Eurytemora carolleeae TaxID=1294199 RepID=UPI000C75E0D3|nr:uncharacterized protein LOC111699967 [Eurytemora carolleeae]|eukprot:XP_023326537.1 uncharacterized protein LOC111699967 [Eurytemora affinis]
MHQANSVTLDPHKSGFCPYPAGGLLYRNGNIRKFLAQKAAYVNHGTGNNEEINLFGIDGSKPGAASAGVWLSHKVIGLHNMGYGLLLEQCTFSAGIMYSLWVSLERSVDPFLVVPAIPVLEEFNGWSKPKIRREILQAENWRLQMNTEAMKFINENGPDTLINCLSLNVRKWNAELSVWENNTDCDLQRRFVKNFYKRCSHSFERPNMVDRGIQIILNATSWGKESHSGAYQEMKNSLGLDAKGDGSIAVIINTCMSPWLRAQKTFQRIGVILRNELYNAYGAIFDEPEELYFVSPCSMFEKDWSGEVFAELEASFSNPSLRYHAIGMFKFPKSILEKIRDLATKAHQQEINSGNSKPMRIKTRSKMTVFQFMTGGDTECVNQPRIPDSEAGKSDILKKPLNEKLEEYSEDCLDYDDIAMPEVGVTVYFDEVNPVETKLKMKRIIRYHHLTRDIVDEKDYPPSQEYFLYSDKQQFGFTYKTHCPNRWPDFQQQIQLDDIPRLAGDPEQQLTESDCLYQEALRRGVVVYLPQIENGGRPLLSNKSANTCRDPLKQHLYNAVSWSDQGAFTGDMHSITLKFFCQWSKRWFNGKNINKGYNRESEPHMYNQAGERRDAKDLESEDEQED